MCEHKHPVILHISDMHFGLHNTEQSEAIRGLVLGDKGLLAELDDVSTDWKPNCVCITGDLGGRGNPEDYESARRWIEQLLTKLGLTPDALFICPGNHDVDRAVAGRRPRPGNATEADRVLQHPIVPDNKYLIEPFSAFTAMCEWLDIPPYRINGWDNYLVGSRELTALGLRVVCLNSAWFSKDDTDKGNLWIGLELIRFLEGENRLPSDQSLFKEPNTVAMVHHPDDWLHKHERNGPDNRKDTMTYLTDRCHILLTGHTHGKPSKPDTRGGRAVHFHGGATFEDADHTNSFRLIRVENECLLYRIYEHQAGLSSSRWLMVMEERELHPNYHLQILRSLEKQSVSPTRTTDVAEENPIPEAASFPGSEKGTTKTAAFKQTAPLPDSGEVTPAVPDLKEPTPAEAETELGAALKAVESRMEHDLSAIKRYSANFEFDSAAEAAERLDEYLGEFGDRIPAKTASIYYELCTFELERVSSSHSSDIAKADYYLGKALLYQEKTNDATG